MKTCPFCAEEIQREAIKCRHCGEFLDGRPRNRPVGYPPGWEYRTQATVAGLPLLHIAYGFDTEKNRPRIAKGIVAIGQVAIGGIAFGGVSAGLVTFGGLAFGLLLAVGGVAVGTVALGGLAGALWLAVGGIAISGKFGIGGLALAPHAIDGSRVDPELLRLLERWFPSLETGRRLRE